MFSMIWCLQDGGECGDNINRKMHFFFWLIAHYSQDETINGFVRWSQS